MKVSQQLARHIFTLPVIITALCLPLSSFAQAPQMAPINPDYIKYKKAESAKTSVQLQGTGEHGTGFIPSYRDTSYLKGKRLFNGTRLMGTLPSSYDLRDHNKLTSVKNQGSCGSCWAFAAIGSLESNLMPTENWDFSEDNMKNLSGFDRDCCGGGNYIMAAAYFLRWNGPVNETDDPYKMSCTSTDKTVQKHVQQYIQIPIRESFLDNNNIKQAVMDYGAVAVSFYVDDYYLKSATSAYYCNEEYGTNHAVCIVGWDDNYSKSNFKTQPSGDGAFIVKNSWGTSWGSSGYFYMSYYDVNLMMWAPGGVFRADSPDNYSTIYQYDPLGWVTSYGYSDETAWFANVFTASNSDPLTAVGWYTAEPNSPYEVYIYMDPTSGPVNAGALVEKKTGIIANPGYTTIKLDHLVSVTEGRKFSVVVKLTTPGYGYPVPTEMWSENYSSSAVANPGESYLSRSGDSWLDMSNITDDEGVDCQINACLKAYSVNESTVPSDTIPPAIDVTSPTTDSFYYTNHSSIDICGTASDNKSISSVKWENTTLGSGEKPCEDGGSWAIWCARNIVLEPQASNNIVFTATDSDGNKAKAALTVVQDLHPPTVTITSPTAEDYYPRVSSINISGTAFDDNNVASVTWSNSGTGASGECNCTGRGTANASWSASGIATPDGDAANIITVTATDAAGNTSTDTITLVADNVSPTIEITSPTSESSYYPETPSIDISGTASDNFAVANVAWHNSGTNASGTCARTGTGSVSWSASGIILADGEYANVITVTATDISGNTSTDTLTVTHYPALKEIQIYPGNVGLVQGMTQKFTAVPIDINGNVRPFPSGTTTSWSWEATTGEINAQTGDFTAGSISSIITLTAGSATASADVTVFPKSVAGGYMLERWWGGSMNKPVGVAFGPDGSVYLADSLKNRIQKYSSTGSYDQSFIGMGSSSFNTPRGIAVDSSANFYVSDTKNNRIQKYDSSWQYITQWGTYGAGNGQFVSPHGIAIDDNDNVYVADSGNNRIQKFDQLGNYIAQLTSSAATGGSFWWPRDVAVVDADGSKFVYVLDTLNNRVVKFSESSNSLTAMLSAFTTSIQSVAYTKVPWGGPETGDGKFTDPAGIMVDASGNVLVTDCLNNRVQIFDSTGKFIDKWGESGTSGFQFMQPTGIGHDSEGSVYVVDTNNDRVQKYVPDTETSVTIDPPEDGFDGYWHDSHISLSGASAGLVVSVLWANSTTGESGVCTGTRNWTLANVPLVLGRNSITITALDSSSGQTQDTLVVYYTLDDHMLTISTPSLTPAIVASGATTAVSAAAADSLNCAVTYTWSDGGAGGSFANAHAASTTYTAPVNTKSDDKTVTITCQAVCQVDSGVVASAFSQLIVTGIHEISVTSLILDPSTVDPGGQTACGVTAEDSRDDEVTYQWSDSGAGGAFYPSSNVQSPTYTAPDNNTESDKHITIACTITCSAVSSVKAVQTATLIVSNPAPTISITSPTSDESITRTGASISLSGTASSDTTYIAWSNMTTHVSGTIPGATNWQIGGIALLNDKSNIITVTAYDAGNQKAVDGIEVIRKSTPVSSAWLGVCMAALPIIPDDTDPGNVVNFFDVDWMMYKTKSGIYFGYGNDPNHYCWFDPTSATPGRGFWAMFKSIPEDPCGTVPDQATSTTKKPNVVSIHLYKGWNLIGQPFMNTVTWDTSKISVATTSGVSISAGDFGKYVSSYAWGWHQDDSNPYTGEYYLVGDPKVISGATNEMAPWRAYWVRALQECYMVIPAP